MRIRRVGFSTLVLLALPILALAQNPTGATGSTFVRGKVTAIQADQITVAPHSGRAPVTIPMQKGFTVALISPAKADIMKVGNLLNIVEVDQPDGTHRALFVDLLVRLNTPRPPVPGRSLSQLPGEDEFAAWGSLGYVTAVEKAPGGTVVSLQFPDAIHKSFVPDGAVMVRNDPSDASIVKVGENVNVIVRTGPDGKMVGNRVLVGANGTKPVM